MKCQTTIDTVGIQIDAINEMTRNMMLEGILALYKRENLYIAYKDYPINQHSNFYIREYYLYANKIVVASIKTGSFSIKDTITNVVTTTYYISLEFAGLMRYNQILDQITNSTLFKTCAYLNSNLITFKLTGLDVCIDLYTKFENVLALCTKKTPKTLYWATYEEQVFTSTTYIEKIKHNKLHQAVQRAYLYDKAVKEGLEYNLTRFEVKLQPKFFNKNRENVILGIMNSLDKYHVMYVPNKKEKQHLMREYDSHSILRQRDIKKLKFEDFNPIYTKLNIEDISDRFGDIQILETAIKEKKEVKCSYDDERHDIYATTIQPLKIVNFEGFWYLLALRDDALKKYYLKNISNPKITDTTFETNNELDTLLDESISVWFQRDIEPFQVKIFADKSCAKFFKRRPLPTQKVESLNTDGTMEFTVKITHEMEILPIIKYWIPHLFVIEPEWVKEIVEEDLEEYMETMKELKN